MASDALPDAWGLFAESDSDSDTTEITSEFCPADTAHASIRQPCAAAVAAAAAAAVDTDTPAGAVIDAGTGAVFPLSDNALLAAIFAVADDAIALHCQRLHLVCKQFYCVLRHEPACWHSIILRPPSISSAFVTDALVQQLVRRHGAAMRSIDVNYAPRLTAAAVAAIAHHCPQLRYVSLVGCIGVGSAAVRFIARRCPALQEALVAGTHAADPQGKKGACSVDAVLLALARAEAKAAPIHLASAAASATNLAAAAAVLPAKTSHSQLRSLSIAGVQSDESVVTLLRRCRHLTELNLSASPRLPCGGAMLAAIACRGAAGSSTEEASDCSGHGAPLVSLKLGSCVQLGAQATALRAPLAVLSRCTSLRRLFLGGCTSISADSGLAELLCGCAYTLEELSLVGCTRLGASTVAAALLAPPTGMPRLRSLILGGTFADNRVCEAVARACPALRTLDLWNCSAVTGVGVEHLVTGAGMGAQPLPLTALNIRECLNVPGSALVSLCEVNRQRKGALALHTLDAGFIGPLCDADVLPILRHHADTLQCLNLGGPGCSVGDELLRLMPASITAIDLTECVGIASFTPLTRMRSLSSLNVDGCRITTAQLLAICAACPLTTLNIARTRVISGIESVRSIVQLLPRLLSLELRGCSELLTAGCVGVHTSVPGSVSALTLLDAISTHCRELLHLGLGDTPLANTEANRERVLTIMRRKLPACDVVTVPMANQ